MKVIENNRYHAWLILPLNPCVELQQQQLTYVYAFLREFPGKDQYDILLKDENYQALLKPMNNTFCYSAQVHKLLECLQVTVEVVLVASPPSYLLDSPIEQAFWDAWLITAHSEHFELIPQYPIDKYRVDFANIQTKIAIELDGFASHSSTEDIANDRKRQREIEALGWRFIRFGGKEIHANALKCAQEAGAFIKKTYMETPAPLQKTPLTNPTDNNIQARIEQAVRRDPAAQEVIKTFSARIIEVRPGDEVKS